MPTKIRPLRSTNTGAVPAPTVAEDVGEIAINLADKKVYARDASGVAQLVADRIEIYDSTRQYVVGDICVLSNILYRCQTAVTRPEAFNPSKWDALSNSGGGGGGGASVTTGDFFPLNPELNDLHYLTSNVVGMYIFYFDGINRQWVMTNGGTNL